MTDILREYDPDHHYQSLSLKYNIDPSANKMDIIIEVLLYGRSCFEQTTPLLATIGEHNQTATSHIHINIVGAKRVEKGLKTNASRHRKTYWQDYMGGKPPLECSCKQAECADIDSVVKCLSYPYKEGNVIEMPSKLSKLYVMLSEESTAFLKTNGEALYQQAQYNRLYKERQNAKQGNLLESILEISKTVTAETWLDWRNQIYEIYFKEIELKEIPDYGLFEKSVQKVAIYSKVVPPYFFCRA